MVDHVTARPSTLFRCLPPCSLLQRPCQWVCYQSWCLSQLHLRSGMCKSTYAHSSISLKGREIACRRLRLVARTWRPRWTAIVQEWITLALKSVSPFKDSDELVLISRTHRFGLKHEQPLATSRQLQPWLLVLCFQRAAVNKQLLYDLPRIAFGCVPKLLQQVTFATGSLGLV